MRFTIDRTVSVTLLFVVTAVSMASAYGLWRSRAKAIWAWVGAYNSLLLLLYVPGLIAGTANGLPAIAAFMLTLPWSILLIRPLGPLLDWLIEIQNAHPAYVDAGLVMLLGVYGPLNSIVIYVIGSRVLRPRIDGRMGA
jgi:hypothetical protein